MTKTQIKRTGAYIGLVVAAGGVVWPLVGLVQGQTRQADTIQDHEKRIVTVESAGKTDHDAITRIDATVSRMEKQVDKIVDHLNAGK